MGNICRSPTAEAVFRHQVKTAGFEKVVHVDSAGTHDFHAGESPDGRAQNAAIQRGYDMKKLRARQVHIKDFNTFHHILAMDKDNFVKLRREYIDNFAALYAFEIPRHISLLKKRIKTESAVC